MDIRLRLVIGIILFIALIYICYTIKKKYIDIRHSLAWFIVWIMLIILDIFPGILAWLTGLMGFEMPVNMLFFLAFCFITMIIFSLSAKISVISEQNKKLTQEIALLNRKFDENNK